MARTEGRRSNSILIGAAVLLLATAAFVTFELWSHYRRAADALQEDVATEGVELAQHLEHAFESLDLALSLAAHMAERHPQDNPPQYLAQNTHGMVRAVSHVMIFDVEGRVLLDGGGDRPFIPLEEARKAIAAQDTPNPGLRLQLVRDADGKDALLAFRLMAKEADRPLRFAAARVSLDFLLDDLRKRPFPPEMHVDLRLADGHSLISIGARPPPILPDFLQGHLTENRQTVSHVSWQGQTPDDMCLAAVIPVGVFPLAVVTAHPVQGLLRTAWDRFDVVLGMSVALALTLLTLAAVISRAALRSVAAAEILRQSESKYRSLMDAVPYAVGVHRDGRYLYVNPAWVVLFGAESAEQVIGRAVLDFVTPSAREMARKRLAAMNQGADKLPIVASQIKSQSGDIIDVDEMMVRIPFQGGPACLSISRDIRERKFAEEQVASLAKFPDQNPGPVLRIDYDGRLLYANKSSRPLLDFWDAVPGGCLPEPWGKIITSLGADGQPREIEITAGAVVYSIVVAPVQDGGYLNLYGRDVTAAKQAEERLRQAQKLEAVGLLAGGVAHDFNNILTAVLGYAHLMLDSFSPQNPHFQDVENILRASYRAKNLVAQILTFSRRTSGGREPVDAALAVAEALDLVRATTPAGIEINSEIADDCGAIWADQAALYQLVVNLCSNAADAMDGEGRLDVFLDTVEKAEAGEPFSGLSNGIYLRLIVQDHGPGIAPAVLARIFDPFFTTKPQGKGMGMGLAVVDGIVGELGGKITARNRVGRGAVFTVLLPRAGGSHPKQDFLRPALPRGSGRILVVDSDAAVAESLARFLRRLGYTTDFRTRSRSALELFSSDPTAFDMAVIDQKLPQMSGIALAREMRRINPKLAIFLCAAHGETESAGGDAADMFAGRIIKPVDFAQLAELAARFAAVRGQTSANGDVADSNLQTVQ